jgi:exo-beta-1,3-glucanase (GH17 family)
MRVLAFASLLLSELLQSQISIAAPATRPAQGFPFLEALRGQPAPLFIGYSPSELDPRNPKSFRELQASSIRSDLQALRPVFDGLVLYGSDDRVTPEILAVANELKFHCIAMCVWNPVSAEELDRAAAQVRLYKHGIKFAVVVGSEGLTMGRYKVEDLNAAAQRLRSKLPEGVPLSTSEPLVQYGRREVRDWGDFAAPHIHAVFDRGDADAADAAKWVRATAMDLARRTNRTVFVRETGFPHGGKQKYTPQSQAAFWRAYTTGPLGVSGEHGAFTYFGVAFEAFDLPWKADASHILMEGSWGLLSHDRKPYLAFRQWKAARRFVTTRPSDE